jgi:hypothetical protein
MLKQRKSSINKFGGGDAIALFVDLRASKSRLCVRRKLISNEAN